MGFSVSSDNSPSTPLIFLRNTSRDGGNGSVQTSASQASRTFLRPASGMTRVTKTLGLATGGAPGTAIPNGPDYTTPVRAINGSAFWYTISDTGQGGWGAGGCKRLQPMMLRAR